jgi:hypothetical protein
MCRRMLGLHNCDVWHTFARSENHNDWVKGLTSTRQEAGFTMLNAASADAVKGEQHAGNEVRPYGLCLWCLLLRSDWCLVEKIGPG